MRWQQMNQHEATVIDGSRSFGVAVISAMAAAEMTMAAGDLASARYCAEVLIACHAQQQAMRRALLRRMSGAIALKSRMPAAMLLPQTRYARSFTCFESRSIERGTPWCCDSKAGSMGRGYLC